MQTEEIYSAAGMAELVDKIGFLPLLNSGVEGYSAEELVADDCRYVQFPEGGWDWPMWKWKGSVINDGGCVYGKFFNKKAGYVSREWWQDFCNYRRSVFPAPEEGTIEDAILATLRENGSMITRELRAMCGFTGPKMRSKFDGYVTSLQMACRIVTEDFIYPRDRHGEEYGWGWSLLTTPEQLYGKDSCRCDRTPEESRKRLYGHFRALLPEASDRQIMRLLS
ncbi:MAG: hypothetical protein K6A78_07930 [Prevotella sp.]|nr:hypothetical protein [Prevotella sp.]